MNAKAIIALVAAVHLGYMAAPVEIQPQVFYVLRGAAGAVMFFVLSRYVVGFAAVFACWLGIFEEGQTAVCGIAEYQPPVPMMSGLCLEWLGRWPYLIATAVSLAYLHRSGIVRLRAAFVSYAYQLRARIHDRIARIRRPR